MTAKHMHFKPIISGGLVISLSEGKIRAPSLALDWQIKRLIGVEARVSYHARRWYVHVAPAFPLAHRYQAVLAWGSLAPSPGSIRVMMVRYAQDSGKLTFQGIFAIMTLLRVFGFKNRNFAGFSSGLEILNPFFDCGGKVAA
jgi:hypothetical protein